MNKSQNKIGFSVFNLSENLLKGIKHQEPTFVQKQAIKACLQGEDVRVAAPTGTGKTLAYLIPAVEKLLKLRKGKQQITVLVLSPTRELAMQIHQQAQALTQYLPLKSVIVCGGMKVSSQIVRLRRKTDILIATPGRLLDLVSQNALNLSNIHTVILDEADRMLDMGFMGDIEKILALIPEDKQMLMFSATYNQQIELVTKKLLTQPAIINVAKQNSVSKTVVQQVYQVGVDKKILLLLDLLVKNNWSQILIFTMTKAGADALNYQLNKNKIASLALHGDLPQSKRSKVINKFKANKMQVLVATDVAARGLDIDDLPCVINYDLPYVAEDYVHRVGRTGRAGASGLAISFVSSLDGNKWRKLTKALNLRLNLLTDHSFVGKQQKKTKFRTNKNQGNKFSRNNASSKKKKVKKIKKAAISA